MFKKEKGMRNREKIISYGDEKEMLERDFYKPEKPTSPFSSSGSSELKFHNKTRTRNGDSSLEIVGPQMETKFFIESEKNTDTHWRSFMERRSSYRQEGPIFLSYTKVRGNKTFLEFREELKSLVENGIIRWIVK